MIAAMLNTYEEQTNMALYKYEKIDDESMRLTETVAPPEPAEPIITVHRKDELQTELAHIPDSRRTIRKKMTALDAREQELIAMLGVFKG